MSLSQAKIWRSRCVLLLFQVAACGGSTEPAVEPGTIRYTVIDETGPEPQTAWEGTASLRRPEEMFIEFSAGRVPDGHNAAWWFGGSDTARSPGTHPVVGHGDGVADTVLVWGGHLVRDDPATAGTVTLTRVTPDRIDGRFRYRGRAGRGADTVYSVVEGEFSATLP